MFAIFLAIFLALVGSNHSNTQHNCNTQVTIMDDDDTGGETGHIPPPPPPPPHP